MSDSWQRQAGQWQRVGAPLRPSDEDVARFEAVVAATTRAEAPLRALVLGVTPELARLAWPAGTDLVAVDKSAEMIAAVWPGFPSPGRGALLADWLALPLPPHSRDVAIGDGSLNCVGGADEHRRLLESVARVLVPGGRFALRMFARPERRETVAEVFADARHGRIRSFHGFKMRLLVACQGDGCDRVRVGDVWTAFREHAPEDFGARAGWSAETVATIDAYRDKDTVYSFPSSSEMRALLEGLGFRLRSVSFGSYELGERCPFFEAFAPGGAPTR